jgi:hypothetical protein
MKVLSLDRHQRVMVSGEELRIEDCLVIGYRKNGDLVVAGPAGDRAATLFLMNHAKQKLTTDEL